MGTFDELVSMGKNIALSLTALHDGKEDSESAMSVGVSKRILCVVKLILHNIDFIIILVRCRTNKFTEKYINCKR